MKSRRRRRYRKNKKLERDFSRYANKYDYISFPRTYQAITRWCYR